MIKYVFKNTIFISILSHITVFTIFSLSFGYKLPRSDFVNVYSLGAILRDYDLIPVFGMRVANPVPLKDSFHFRPLNKSRKLYPQTSDYYLKPQVSFSLNEEKLTFVQKLSPVPSIKKRKELVITFHPYLPVNFLLFFKDRQAVHIELMFNIVSAGRTNSIIIKRKISSGNLEADLLSMRYISHYLFLRQTKLIRPERLIYESQVSLPAGGLTDDWQTVKIDLSAKND